MGTISFDMRCFRAMSSAIMNKNFASPFRRASTTTCRIGELLQSVVNCKISKNLRIQVIKEFKVCWNALVFFLAHLQVKHQQRGFAL
jgi:hypothetical protein